MKTTLLLVAVCLAVSLGSAKRVTPADRHVLINRPKFDAFGPRERRSEPGVKGFSSVKGGAPPPPPPTPLELKVRKGEYVCGNKICKLQPGVVPEGCNGICQYPI